MQAQDFCLALYKGRETRKAKILEGPHKPLTDFASQFLARRMDVSCNIERFVGPYNSHIHFRHCKTLLCL